MRIAINNLKKTSGEGIIKSPSRLPESHRTSRVNLNEVPEKDQKNTIVRNNSQLVHNSSNKNLIAFPPSITTLPTPPVRAPIAASVARLSATPSAPPS